MNMIALEKWANACRPEYDSKITTGAHPMHVRGEFWPNLVAAQALDIEDLFIWSWCCYSNPSLYLAQV